MFIYKKRKRTRTKILQKTLSSHKPDLAALLCEIFCQTQFKIWSFSLSTLMHGDMVAIETMLILTGFGGRFAKSSLLQQPQCETCVSFHTHTHTQASCVYVPVCDHLSSNVLLVCLMLICVLKFKAFFFFPQSRFFLEVGSPPLGHEYTFVSELQELLFV